VIETAASLADPRVRKGLSAALGDLHRRVDDGDRHIGWKVQVSGPAFQKRLGLAGPLIGPLRRGCVWMDGGVAPLPPGRRFVEVELAVRLARDVAVGASLETCGAAIGAMAAAIELLGVDGPFVDAEIVLARNGYHAGVVFGPFAPPPDGFRTADLSLDLRLDGDRIAGLDHGQIVGEPAEVVRLAADLLAPFGEGLRAGHILICGALNPLTEISGPVRLEAALAPVGAVTISLEP